MLAPTLVLGGTIRVVAAIARSLDRRGIPVDVASLQPMHPARTWSRAVRNQFDLPDYRCRPDDFIESLLGLISGQGFDMLIPCSDRALVAIGPHYDELCGRLHVACPSPPIVRRVLDKRISLEAAWECGLRTPRSFLPRGGGVPLEAAKMLRFPVVAKPADKFVGQSLKVRYFETPGELHDASADEPDFSAKYLLQEYFEGQGVGVSVLLWDGEPRAIFQHRRLKEHPYQGGVSTLAEAVAVDPDLVNQAVTLLRRLEWQGVAMVEFRRDPATGSCVLIEVNGRYWGTLPLAIRAGMDFPLYEWQLAHGENPQAPARYAEGLRILWRVGDTGRLFGLLRSHRAHCVGLGAVAREGVRFCRDFVSAAPDAVWTARDPLPALAEVYAKVCRSWTRLARRAEPRRSHQAAGEI